MSKLPGLWRELLMVVLFVLERQVWSWWAPALRAWRLRIG